MSAEPQFADTSDPRVYGYDYETGLTPNFAFDGQWAGAEAIPSSDNGEVVRMSEIHQMQQRQAQAQQQSATIAAMEQQQRAYQQSLQAQPIYEAAPAHNFYVPVPTRPLYPEQGLRRNRWCSLRLRRAFRAFILTLTGITNSGI